jgi:hypothetical protein
VLETLGEVLNEEFEIPADILEIIKVNPRAWEIFQAFSQSYIRIRVAFIDAARNRPAEFQKTPKVLH